METLIAALEKAGFEHDDDSKAAAESHADSADMHRGGPYVIHGIWLRGTTSVKIEQNTAMEDVGGLKAAIEHPSVAVVSGPKGTTACQVADVDLVMRMVQELG